LSTTGGAAITAGTVSIAMVSGSAAGVSRGINTSTPITTA